MLLEDCAKQCALMTMMLNSVPNSFNGASVVGLLTEGEERIAPWCDESLTPLSKAVNRISSAAALQVSQSFMND